MELTSYNSIISWVLLVCKIIYWDDIRNGNFVLEPFQAFAEFFSYIWNQFQFQHWNNEQKSTKAESSKSCEKSSSCLSHNYQQDHDNLGIGEIKMVMNKLGLQFCTEAMSDDWIVEKEIASIFDQEEPSLDEVKEAFDVFDENRDGFIDAVELHRVLSNLGEIQGARSLHDCKRMISRFDENEDGLIDLNEFFRLMETSFC